MIVFRDHHTEVSMMVTGHNHHTHFTKHRFPAVEEVRPEGHRVRAAVARLQKSTGQQPSRVRGLGQTPGSRDLRSLSPVKSLTRPVWSRRLARCGGAPAAARVRPVYVCWSLSDERRAGACAAALAAA